MNSTNVGHGGKVGVPASVRSNGGGGARGGGYIRLPLPENCGPVYHDSPDTGAIPGSRTASSSMVIMTVVGAGRN